MWGEQERSPAFAAPGSNSYAGLIAGTTNGSIGTEVGKVQRLSEAEETDLCKQYGPLVLSLAARYSGKGIAFDELVAAGQLGLVRALRKFDPDRGPFGAYAKHWARGEMTALFKPTDLYSRLGRVSLSIHHSNDERGHQLDVADDAPAIATDLSALTERERQIVEARVSGESLSAIGKDLDISAERVRQLEARARSKTKGAVASECLSDLTRRGKVIRFPTERTRRFVEFKDREPPEHLYREPVASRLLIHHRLLACDLASKRGNAPIRTRNDNGPVIHAWRRP